MRLVTTKSRIHEFLQLRMQYLAKIIERKEAAIKDAPKGSVKGCRHGKSWQYYIRQNPDAAWKYLPADQRDKARRLSQREYDAQILRLAKLEQAKLSRLDSFYNSGAMDEVYENLPEYYQNLVTPVFESAAHLLERWRKTTFTPKEFFEDSPAYYTSRGERMRSKSELLIADKLADYGIPYFYEKPLQLKGLGIVHPDFTLLDLDERREIYWEHMGRIDDSDYREGAMEKINSYILNGILPGDRLILTFETKKHPLNTKVVDKLISSLNCCRAPECKTPPRKEDQSKKTQGNDGDMGGTKQKNANKQT